MTTRFIRFAVVPALFLASAAFAGVIGRPIEPVVEKPFGEIRKAPRPAPEPFINVIVEFRETASSKVRSEAVRTRVEDLQSDLEAVQVNRTFSRLLFGASIRVPRESLPQIEKLPYVAAVHLERKFEALAVDASPRAVSSRSALVKAGTMAKGAGVQVAVIDSGIDYTHPALAGKVVDGWDFVNDDADAMDDNGHGTHVSGIIAADGDGLLGVAPGVSLVAYKVIHAGGFGMEADIIAAIERTVDPNQDGDFSDHVDIANMSLGGPAADDDPVVKAVEKATAAGVLFTIAMGNSGAHGYVYSPAFAPSAISVAATTAEGEVAWFSTRGPSFDYAIKPEISAPGVEILSSIPGGKKARASGTSMAAPYVAGVAAVVKALHPGWSPAEVKAAVIATSLPTAENVMIAGAGHANADAVAKIATISQPSVLSFGRDAHTEEVWTSSQTITLRNVTAASQTLTAAVTGLREGLSVRVTPDVVTLAAGESRTATVELSVTNALVPAPKTGSLSYSGRVEWTGGSVPAHLPWAFVKGTYFKVEEVNGAIAQATVIGDSGKVSYGEFRGPARIFWPLEKADIIVSSFGYPIAVTVAEQVDVSVVPVVGLNLDDARFTIAPDTTDENGQPLRNGIRQCHEKFVLAFPQGKKVSFEAVAETRTLFSRLTPRIRIHVGHTCGDAAAGTMHAALHEPIAGLEESIISTLRPRWLRQDVRFTPDVAREGSMIGALMMMRFPGPESKYYYDGGEWYLMRQTTSLLAMYFTPSPDPEVDLVSMLEWSTRACDPDWPEADCRLVDNIFLYVNDRTITAETDVFLELSPMGYQLPVGETITFGRAPVSPQVRFDTWSGGWGMVAFWMGPLGERRVTDTVEARVSLYDAAGTVVGQAFAGMVVDEPLAPGRYRVESVDPVHRIGAMPGKATFTGWLDTTRKDFLLPMFTGLRIVDDRERQASVVARNSHPSLLFSVADIVRGKVIAEERVPPREEATRVEYRRHGATAWHPLPALVQARHYPFSTILNGGVGTMYRVDLSAATDFNGPVDLRVLVEDMSGNTAEVLLEPAMWVGDTRRRAVGK